VDIKDSFNLVDQAGEMLRHKLAQGQVPEIHKPVVKIALEQIRLFLTASSCQKSEVLEIVNYSPVRPDDLAETKMRIANTLEQELRAKNLKLTQDEFNKLVEAEFVRVKYKMSNRSFGGYQTQNNSASNNTPNQNMFSAYQQPIRNPNLLPSVSGIHQLNTGSISENSVNWRLLSDAVKNAQHSELGTSHFYGSTQLVSNPFTFGYNSPPPQPDQNFVQASHSTHSISAANSASSNMKTDSKNESLTEEEIVSLLINMQKLSDADKKQLLSHMKELQGLDKVKFDRVNKKYKKLLNKK